MEVCSINAYQTKVYARTSRKRYEGFIITLNTFLCALHIALDKNSALEGACDVIVIFVRNGHGDLSSNPERSRLHFT